MENTDTAAPATELFGSFMLGEDEFALPASCIREVVNFPERLTALPLCPPYLEGMFTLRGSVIPVVNLGRLFDPDAPAAAPSHKIAIIDHQDVLVGILFHATGEILRVRPEQRTRLAYDGAAAPGVIAGTILLDNGARLLQILAPASLVRVENVPQVVALRIAAQPAGGARAALGRRRHCVTFRSGGSRFALEMAAIQEIIRVPELQGSVLNSKLCLGRFNFRGSQVAAVDFATLLGGEAAAPGPERRVIVARIDHATIGFLVDEVDSIVHFASEELLPIPLLSKARAAMFGGCLTRPDGADIILLDHQGIFSHAEITRMHQGHAALFLDQGQVRAERKTRRKVYLTFRVQESYALEITQVREIIDRKGDITRPPGMPPHVAGVLNLRQRMVILIDLRQLYGMAPLEQEEGTKVLVIERGEERYGLVVDGVETIVTIDDSHRYGAPQLMRGGQRAGGPQSESSEVLELPLPDGGTRTVCMFDCARLLDKLAPEGVAA
ncbi:chemotaxis protein CheW [Pseudoduganella namucuonensis]|uniref:CheW protein n=1 Tax=Pseudoduganella namucuonensis TaxID=1035707 RepID=A0A1I7HCU9_9BURK|nr:chemotaxis protein CheW [Pseudoduganella namucuonensis]SFU58432.1 CheW protein [Pseudoduganella namucuonensis]